MKEHGSIFMHPFDDPVLIAGYGSLAVEILDAVPNVDIILVGCGGGGSLAGISAAINTFTKRKVKVYGVEPETANAMDLSLKVLYGALTCMKLTAPMQGLTSDVGLVLYYSKVSI